MTLDTSNVYLRHTHRDTRKNVVRIATCVTAKRRDRRKAEEKSRKETRKEGGHLECVLQHVVLQWSCSTPTAVSEMKQHNQYY